MPNKRRTFFVPPSFASRALQSSSNGSLAVVAVKQEDAKQSNKPLGDIGNSNGVLKQKTAEASAVKNEGNKENEAPRKGASADVTTHNKQPVVSRAKERNPKEAPNMFSMVSSATYRVSNLLGARGYDDTDSECSDIDAKIKPEVDRAPRRMEISQLHRASSEDLFASTISGSQDEGLNDTAPMEDIHEPEVDRAPRRMEISQLHRASSEDLFASTISGSQDEGLNDTAPMEDIHEPEVDRTPTQMEIPQLHRASSEDSFPSFISNSQDDGRDGNKPRMEDIYQTTNGKKASHARRRLVYEDKEGEEEEGADMEPARDGADKGPTATNEAGRSTKFIPFTFLDMFDDADRAKMLITIDNDGGDEDMSLEEDERDYAAHTSTNARVFIKMADSTQLINVWNRLRLEGEMPAGEDTAESAPLSLDTMESTMEYVEMFSQPGIVTSTPKSVASTSDAAGLSVQSMANWTGWPSASSKGSKSSGSLGRLRGRPMSKAKAKVVHPNKKPKMSGKREPTSQSRQRSDTSSQSQPSQSTSTPGLRQRLEWLQESRDVGLWVMCDACDKDRYLPDCKDPLELPDKWFCRMHPDPALRDCNAQEVGPTLAEQADLVRNIYTSGSLVWGQLNGYPWWPAMVDDCPDVQDFYWLDGLSDVPTHYNVTFFDQDAPSRAWLTLSQLRPFTGMERSRRAKRTDEESYTGRLAVAKAQAMEALALEIAERRKRFSFLARYEGAIGPLRPLSVELVRKELAKIDKALHPEVRQRAISLLRETDNSDDSSTEDSESVTGSVTVFEDAQRQKGEDSQNNAKRKKHPSTTKKEYIIFKKRKVGQTSRKNVVKKLDKKLKVVQRIEVWPEGERYEEATVQNEAESSDHEDVHEMPMEEVKGNVFPKATNEGNQEKTPGAKKYYEKAQLVVENDMEVQSGEVNHSQVQWRSENDVEDESRAERNREAESGAEGDVEPQSVVENDMEVQSGEVNHSQVQWRSQNDLEDESRAERNREAESGAEGDVEPQSVVENDMEVQSGEVNHSQVQSCSVNDVEDESRAERNREAESGAEGDVEPQSVVENDMEVQSGEVNHSQVQWRSENDVEDESRAERNREAELGAEGDVEPQSVVENDMEVQSGEVNRSQVQWRSQNDEEDESRAESDREAESGAEIDVEAQSDAENDTEAQPDENSGDELGRNVQLWSPFSDRSFSPSLLSSAGTQDRSQSLNLTDGDESQDLLSSIESNSSTQYPHDTTSSDDGVLTPMSENGVVPDNDPQDEFDSNKQVSSDAVVALHKI